MAAETPAAVSPGDASKPAVVESGCPTFSWSTVANATSYELVLYRLGEEAAPEPVLREIFSGSASSWTPSLDRCLERGGRYAWSVRAVGEKAASEWSTPSLFRVAAGPSEADLEEAREIVRTYFETPSVAPARGAVAGTSGPVSSRRAESSRPAAELISTFPPPAFQILGSSAELTVVGEVRTVDSGGEPRLWGVGRPDGFIYGNVGRFCTHLGVSFGLTRGVATWGKAAEVCPAGSWVCRIEDVEGSGSCNTARPYDFPSLGAAEWYQCDGAFRHFTTSQTGWLADAGATSNLSPATFGETGSVGAGHLSCRGLPVWCCWK
jgi:hypothetical protein